MKMIYEIPELTIFEVGPSEQLLGGSNDDNIGTQIGNDTQTITNDWTKGNGMDDDTPWYRR